jgi:hypothetical protein
MSINYSLAYKSNTTLLEAQNILKGDFNLDQSESYLSLDKGLFISLTPSTARSRNFYSGYFGFEPDITVVFEIDKFGNQELLLRDMISMTSDILSKFAEDAVMLFNGEILILQKREGLLTLNAEWADWGGDMRLSQYIKMPHKLESLPSPL